MKKIYLCLSMLLAITTIISCEKPSVNAQDSQKEEIAKKEISSATAVVTHSRNLTVAYLIPSDLDTLAGYKARVSGVLSWVQNWYKEEMNRNGYANKTFGLVKDPNNTELVQINVIRSARTTAQMKPSGTFDNAAAVTEVDAYFNLPANVGKKQSQHILILMPPMVGGNPYYGYNRYCFATEKESQNVDNIGTPAYTGSISGFAHELGHAFGLPHNQQRVSVEPVSGRTLMGGSVNYRLGYFPTILSEADAATLNTCEIFNNNTNTYYGNIDAFIPKINFSFNATTQSIVASGRYTTTGVVADVVAYNDPEVNNEGVGTNNDYNAVTWKGNKIGTDSFNFVMPIADLYQKGEGMVYELKVKLIHSNGIIKEDFVKYTFTNGVPVLNAISRTELSKDTWIINSASSQETIGEGAINGRSAKVIDGLTDTYWHSNYTSTTPKVYPHWVIIDFGSEKVVNGVSLTQHSALLNAVKDFGILTRQGTTGNFSSSLNKTAQNVTGVQYFDFPEPRTIRYLWINTKNAHNGSTRAALAEIGAY